MCFISFKFPPQKKQKHKQVFSLTNKQDGQQIISQNKQTRRFIKQKLISMDFPCDWLVDFLTNISYVLYSYTHYLTNITYFSANNFYSDTWSDVSLCTLPICVCVCAWTYMFVWWIAHTQKKPLCSVMVKWCQRGFLSHLALSADQ